MDACFRSRFGRTGTLRTGSIAALMVAIAVLATNAVQAANFRTQNFIIQAPSPSLAQAVGQAAEKYRNDLAVYWTGQALPPWPAPCPIRVVAGPNLAAQGVTTYNPAPVRDFQMEVIGTPERILDSVLPHEVTHTVLATYFGRPLPRWADEGICTTVEHASEKAKHEAKLREFLSSRRGIAMNRLFLLTEYPPDVLPMYAQGYSVCRFLIEQQGPTTFISFLKDYVRRPSWTANVQKHYGYDSLAELQQYWLSWVEAGSGPVARFAKLDPIGTSQGDARDAIASVAPATRLASRERGPRNPVVAPPESLVAANDRGRLVQAEANSVDAGSGSWYHRRDSGIQTASHQIASLNAPANQRSSESGLLAIENVPQGNAFPDPLRRDVAQDAKPRWAPPSVLSSGRYSSATPQGETSGSLHSDYSRLNHSRSLGSSSGVWR